MTQTFSLIPALTLAVLSPIATLPGLHNLSIVGSAVTDLSPLHTLPAPEVGTLSVTVGENVPEREIEALKAARPEFNIRRE